MKPVRCHPRAAYVAMPWKNGGGVTHEILRRGDGAGGFALRLSMAEVATDGPFSAFPGVDRVICLFRGAGFTLDDGEQRVRIEAIGAPFAFRGEAPFRCALIGGPVLDFNVMTDRATTRAAVWRHAGGELDAQFALLLDDAPEGAAGDLLELVAPIALSTAAIAVRVSPIGG